MPDNQVRTQSPSEIAVVAEPELRALEAVSHRLERGALLPLIVFLAAGLVYASLFCHAESIPTAVGANLVPAERVLKGQVPYRDFYKIQTPGILLINAGLFKLFGVSLLTAMSAVFVFKVFTITLVFVCTRSVSNWKLALCAALLSLVWVAPGGPFRSAPVQFETLFVVSALWFTLRWMSDGRSRNIFLAGLAVGIVAVLKQNVGVYSAVALAGSVIFNRRSLLRRFEGAEPLNRESLKGDLRILAAAALGFAVPLAAITIYLATNGALGAAIKIFLKGPGEHLLSRFTGYPAPKAAALIIAAAVLALLIARRLVEKYPRRRVAIITLLFAGAAVSALLTPRAAVTNMIYWFAPSLFICALWKYYRGASESSSEYAPSESDRAILLTLLLFSMAAYGEVFPRSVRGLVIDTMPPAFILLAFLCSRRRSTGTKESKETQHGGGLWLSEPRVVLGAVLIVLLVFSARIVGPSFFAFEKGRGLHLKADTELNFDRGRGVYLPAMNANDVNATVELIRSRVEPGGYMFAHSLDTTSYYFLADRNSPTAATLWNDTGTNDDERARIIGALQDKQVRLVLTSNPALARERYRPLLDMLSNDFHELTRIDDIIFLERNY